MRIVDVLLALPGILFAMALIAVLGRSQSAALVAVGITGVPGFARITRAQVLSLRQRDFVIAVEALGGSASYNMFRTVLPNAWTPILVQVVILSSVAILLEAALAFLGVGIPPPTPSWGEMLRTGKSYLYEAPYYAVLPGIVLTLTILSLDTLGRVLASVLEDRREVAEEEAADQADEAGGGRRDQLHPAAACATGAGAVAGLGGDLGDGVCGAGLAGGGDRGRERDAGADRRHDQAAGVGPAVGGAVPGRG